MKGKTKNIKGSIYQRLKVLRVVLLIVAGLIVFSIWRIQQEESAVSQTVLEERFRIDTLEAARGTIFSSDKNVLASSFSFFDVYWDPNVEALSDQEFEENAPLLAREMSQILPNETEGQILKRLRAGREGNKRYMSIAKKVNYLQLEDMKTWPIFKRGRLKGGFIAESFEHRVRPFEGMGSRTVGYVRNSRKVGLEGAYDDVLRGTQSICRLRQMGTQGWLPVAYLKQGERVGMEVYSTIDTRLQDYASTALEESLTRSRAHHGCAVVMEVETGAIRAMANLERTKEGDYQELFNYAIQERTYPGSTFKLATLISLLQDGYVSLNKTVSIEKGRKKYFDTWMHDDHFDGHDILTVKRIMEISSNVGISKMANDFYYYSPEQFLGNFRKMGLMDKTGISIKGEETPTFPVPNEGNWSGISVPWLSIGYEAQITPLQMLALYAAVGNDGERMKPYLVEEVRKDGRLVEQTQPESQGMVCDEHIAKKLQQVLRGVVEGGTAKGIKEKHFLMAGKTGTAQLKKTKNRANDEHQASFVGLFPADDPKFACIVVVNKPENGEIYGAQLGAPVFREIVRGAYALYPEWHREIEVDAKEMVPPIRNGSYKDVQLILTELGIPSYGADQQLEDQNAEPFVKVRSDETGVKFSYLKDEIESVIPNVVGYGLRDAVYLLESRGLRVSFHGKGKVKSQSVKPGSVLQKGDPIKLELA